MGSSLALVRRQGQLEVAPRLFQVRAVRIEAGEIVMGHGRGIRIGKRQLIVVLRDLLFAAAMGAITHGGQVIAARRPLVGLLEIREGGGKPMQVLLGFVAEALAGAPARD